MRTIDTIIIGGGQAGLALSHCLGDRGVEHVVLERGRIGERWRSERWDSLHLLTPRWQSRLPGFRYDGPDPDGYMSRLEVIQYLERYARSFAPPLETGVAVTRVRRDGLLFGVETDRGSWRSANVVIATGQCDRPRIPAVASGLHGDIHQVAPTEYRNPAGLPDGGVLVVGASATGIQLATEIHASGRPVTLAVGRHTRLPRTYRGQDILWWLDRMGILHQRTEEIPSLEASKAQPSLQLVGSPDRRTLDLRSAQAQGIRITGRVAGADGYRVQLGDTLVEDVVSADVKLARLRIRIDRFATEKGLDERIPAPAPFSMIDVPEGPAEIDLARTGIRTVMWATGFTRHYPWLDVPVVGADGEIVHRGGVTPERGLYVLGLNFLRRRSSTFIDGQARDAQEIAEHMMTLRRGARPMVA